MCILCLICVQWNHETEQIGNSQLNGIYYENINNFMLFLPSDLTFKKHKFYWQKARNVKRHLRCTKSKISLVLLKSLACATTDGADPLESVKWIQSKFESKEFGLIFEGIFFGRRHLLAIQKRKKWNTIVV